MRQLILLLVVTATVLGTLPLPGVAGAQDTVPACGEGCAVLDAEGAGDAYVPGQVLVGFEAGTPGQRRGEIMASERAKAVRRIPALNVVTLDLPPGLSVEQGVARFGRYKEVRYAEPNYLLHAIVIDDPGVDLNQWAPQRLGAPQAWQTTAGDSNVVIAIVDTGVDYTHSELAPNLWTNPDEAAGLPNVDDDNNGHIDDLHGWDYVNGDSDPMDDMWHGTHVAGIAVADDNANAAGLSGICPDCSFMPVKVLNASGTGSLDTVASGMVYAADKGAQVINLSLGGTAGSQALGDAVDYAWAAGAVVVAGAGNNLADSFFYPAAYPSAIAVASTDAEDLHSCFSNYKLEDSFVDVSAPGEEIYSTGPRALGQDTYRTESGTSMSTPHVSGLAGLLFSQDLANRTNQDVRNLIETTADDLGPTGYDPYFGSGRVSVARAVAGIDTGPARTVALPSTELTASSYGHTRKLARDADGTLHLAWHSIQGDSYQVLYATRANAPGAGWTEPEVVFSSTAKTYHPALVLDHDYVYVAFPSLQGSAKYRTFFTRKPRLGGSWSAAVPLTDGVEDAVLPALYLEPASGRLHMAAASFGNAQNLYYAASGNQGGSWDVQSQFDPNDPQYPECEGNTRYAAVYANGSNIYIATRTLRTSCLFPPYFCSYLYCTQTARSTDGGQTWPDANKEKLASWDAQSTAEYGLSLAGVGDRLYMGYEVGSGSGGGLYFRRWDGSAWSNYQLVASTGLWPTITQAADGKAWMMWQDNGDLIMRHYDGTAWEPAETVWDESEPQPEGHDKPAAYYPNLAPGLSGGRLDWVFTTCKGGPHELMVDSRQVGGDSQPAAQIVSPTADSILAGSATVQISATDVEDAPGTLLVEWNVDGGAWQAATYDTGSATYQASWDTGTVADGGHVLNARASDSAGNTTSAASVSVTVENVNEAPTVTIVHPLEASLVSGEVAVQIDAADAENAAGTLAVEWKVDDGAWQPASYQASGYYEASWDSSQVADGPHTLYAQATDAATSTGQATPIAVTTENLNEPPAAAIVAPSNGSTVAGDTPIQISAGDEEDAPGTLAVQWRIDTGLWLAATYNSDSGFYEETWSTASYSEGSHTIEARATDSKLATTDAQPVTVTVDNADAPPSVIIVNPSNASTVSGPITVRISANDAEDAVGSLDVAWSVDEGGWLTAAYNAVSGYYEDAWDPAGVGDGSHVVHARASDSGNNTSFDQNTVTVDLSEPPAGSMHVGDLADERNQVKNKWTAGVIITVHDASHLGVTGATVSGTWSNGASGTSQCTTGGSGSCLVSYGGLLTKVPSVDFTVDQVSHPTLSYAPIDNHDLDGDSDGTTITVYLEPPTNQPPAASFTYGCQGLACSFDASASSDPDGTIAGYAWTFGDGAQGSVVQIDHTYAAEGSYTVTLRVTDNGGAEATSSQVLSLGGAAPPTLFVSAIDMSGKRAGPNATATATVTIHDTGDNPVEGATVTGTWSGDYSGPASGITLADGTVRFASGKSLARPANFTFTVDSVAKEGWLYDADFNVLTWNSQVVP